MIYLAIQDNVILGIYNSYDEAEKRIDNEVENDKIKHVLKRGVARTILKGRSKIPSFEDRYCIATCLDENIVYKFDPTEPSNLLMSTKVTEADRELYKFLHRFNERTKINNIDATKNIYADLSKKGDVDK